MNKRPVTIKRLSVKMFVAVCLVALLSAGPSFAQEVVVDFIWRSDGSDPNDGEGFVFATIDGINFLGTMPTPTLNQKGTLVDPNSSLTIPTTGPGDVGAPIGFANQARGSNPGSIHGFHLGWASTTATMFGSRDGIDYELTFDLTFGDGDFESLYSYSYTTWDDPIINGGAGEVEEDSIRFSGWIGEDLGGHRQTGDTENWLFGQDVFVNDASGNIGNNGDEDDIGITVAVRDWSGSSNDTVLPTGNIFISDLSFGGTVPSNQSNISPALVPAEIGPIGATTPFPSLVDIGTRLQQVNTGAGWLEMPVDPYARDAGTNGGGFTNQPIVVDPNTTFFLSLSEGDGSTGDIDWRDRGDSDPNNLNLSDELVKLGEDFVKNNNGDILLTLSSLPLGEYTVTSYHMDPGFIQSNEISVSVDIGVGSGLVLQGDTGDASADLVDGVNSLSDAAMIASSATFDFIALGTGDVQILFESADVGDDEVPLNGFQLDYTPFTKLPGDVNLDDLVNDADIQIIANNFFSAGSAAQGDVDGNGFVDVNDWRIWQAFNGQDTLPLSAASVPEPTSLGIALLGAVALFGIGRRRI